jgi:hypothetical protein
VACIEALHRAAQIQDVPPEYVSEGNEGQKLIAGVDEAVRQVWATGKLFAELDVPFALQEAH